MSIRLIGCTLRARNNRQVAAPASFLPHRRGGDSHAFGPLVDATSDRVRISVQLDAAVAREFATSSLRSDSAKAIRSLIDNAGATVSANFPDVNDTELQQWFTVVAPKRTASALLTQLQYHEAILAAYIKPAEGMP